MLLGGVIYNILNQSALPHAGSYKILLQAVVKQFRDCLAFTLLYRCQFPGQGAKLSRSFLKRLVGGVQIGGSFTNLAFKGFIQSPQRLLGLLYTW